MNRRGLYIAMLSACSLGCGGQIGPLPADTAVKAFEATVGVSPLQVVAGQRVTFSIEVVSDSNTQVLADVELRVLDENLRPTYQQLWRDVIFEPEDTWNLTEGYLPDTTVRTAHHVEITVREKSSGRVLFRNAQLATLDFT